jgi:putative two-component system response regulator
MMAPHLISAGANLEPASNSSAEAIRLTEQLVQESTILIVDGLEMNRRVVRSMLKMEHYRILEASRASEAFDLLEREKVDLIVLDLVLPEIGGTEFCRRLRANPHTQLIPTLMLTSVQGIENEVAGLSSGADEFLLKPLHPAVVRVRVQRMLHHKAVIDNLDVTENILFTLAEAVEQRDKGTGEHCQRLAAISLALGERIGLNASQLRALRWGAYLHDIGKLCVPDAILLKTDGLTLDEWEIMRQHTIKGEAICRGLKSLAPVLPIIRHHHERWDGTGYPDGLKGEEIPLLARVLQLADIFDALTSARSYKPAFTCEKALEMIAEEAHRGWRDPVLVERFCEVMLRPDNPPLDSSIEPLQQSLENMIRQLSR